MCHAESHGPAHLHAAPLEASDAYEHHDHGVGTEREALQSGGGLRDAGSAPVVTPAPHPAAQLVRSPDEVAVLSEALSALRSEFEALRARVEVDEGG